jgi:methyltransferase
MISWPLWAIAVLAYVVIQRLAELAYANANTKRLLAEGGEEFGRSHYPLFILLHGSWLIATLLFAMPSGTPDRWLLGTFILSQLFRFWTLASIGRWWTTRIISAPHFPRVKKGPYRFIPHPNYSVVVVEIFLLPFLLGAPWVAVVFSALNLALVTFRIIQEEQVLSQRDWLD